MSINRLSQQRIYNSRAKQEIQQNILILKHWTFTADAKQSVGVTGRLSLIVERDVCCSSEKPRAIRNSQAQGLSQPWGAGKYTYEKLTKHPNFT